MFSLHLCTEPLCRFEALLYVAEDPCTNSRITKSNLVLEVRNKSGLSKFVNVFLRGLFFLVVHTKMGSNAFDWNVNGCVR